MPGGVFSRFWPSRSFRPDERHLACLMRSIARALWCLAAGMSFYRFSGMRCCRSGLDFGQFVPRRLWRGAGGPGTALHFRLLPWRGGDHPARRHSRRGYRLDRDFSAGGFDPDGRVAVLGSIADAPSDAGRCAGNQCGCRRPSRRGPLQSSVDKRRRRPG